MRLVEICNLCCVVYLYSAVPVHMHMHVYTHTLEQAWLENGQDVTSGLPAVGG